MTKKKAEAIAPVPLADCEANGMAPAYVSDPERHTVVPFDAKGREVYVVSDLHVAAGRSKDGNFEGTENFFADDSFARFLSDLRRRKPGTVLVINGDFIDFLRVNRVPRSEDDFEAWRTSLERIGIKKSVQELRQSITTKEETYGLKTDDYKSVWKLRCSAAGHPQMFRALGEWVAAGESLIIVKGNHDLEWYWLAVRNYLRLIVAEYARETLHRSVDDILKSVVLPNVTFIDDAMLVEGMVYIEHGHRYDRFSKPIGGPVLENGTELNLPFGSFFNRYLINRVELVFPYIDNVRPREKLLPLLFRERFPLALRVLFDHLPFALLSVQKRYYRYMFTRVLTYVLAIGVPAVFVIVRYWTDINDFIAGLQAPGTRGIVGLLVDQLTSFALSTLGLFFSYALARIVSFFQLDEPSSLAQFAQEGFSASPKCRYVTFGHTHDPEQFNFSEQWYHNTGTWIPVIDVDSADIREDKTYTFLHYHRKPDGSLGTSSLHRWNDEAGRVQQLILIDKKDQPTSAPW